MSLSTHNFFLLNHYHILCLYLPLQHRDLNSQSIPWVAHLAGHSVSRHPYIGPVRLSPILVVDTVAHAFVLVSEEKLSSKVSGSGTVVRDLVNVYAFSQKIFPTEAISYVKSGTL